MSVLRHHREDDPVPFHVDVELDRELESSPQHKAEVERWRRGFQLRLDVIAAQVSAMVYPAMPIERRKG